MLAAVLLLMPMGNAEGQTPQTYTESFLLLNRPGGDKTYELNLTIPQNLYQYYTRQSHFVFSENSFPKFVTPYTLKPIADRLWQIYNNTEDFTNGVLMLVHQITYEETVPSKYPVETLVAGKGDCDLFVYIAASILEAGGIHTVLLFYKDQQHMEIGVDLGSPPADARSETFHVTYQNVSYYIAECTGGVWRDGWRVGECPAKYQNVTAQVVTLENMEQSSIGQVSVALRELDPSTLSLQVSSSLTLGNSEIAINGQILPETAGENVTLQANINGGGWITIATVETQADGRFSYKWVPSAEGMIDLQASWLGNRQYNGAASSPSSIVVLPLYFIAAIASSVAAVAIVIIAFVKTRHKPQPPPPPELPPQNLQP